VHILEVLDDDLGVEDCVHRVFQVAVPDVAYTDPGHGKETIVELIFMATKLNAQVTGIIKNLQNMHEKSLPLVAPTGARRRMELEYQDWARLQGRGPRTGAARASGLERRKCAENGVSHTDGRTFRPHHRVAVVVEPWDLSPGRARPSSGLNLV
jgi:hypothetical protein